MPAPGGLLPGTPCPKPVPDDPKLEPSGEIAPTSTGSRIYINATATRRLVGAHTSGSTRHHRDKWIPVRTQTSAAIVS
jgi:hypothetical protein